MNIPLKFFLLLAFNTASVLSVKSQIILTQKMVDTEPLELYLELVNSIKQTGMPNKNSIQAYFSNPTVSLFNQRPGFDSLKFVNNLKFAYIKGKKDSSLLTLNDDYKTIVKYKENELLIRNAIVNIKKTAINELIKKRLKPFFDESTNLASSPIKNIYLFLDEGNGGFPGYVFNSGLQTAYLAESNIDLISAHEAYHSITSGVFMQKFANIFNVNSDTARNYQNLLQYLEIVAEEGIADLIDKPVLSRDKSPLGKELQKLGVNENAKSVNKIKQLDSLFSSNTINFAEIYLFLENGGHIPGRYMGLKIQQANLLKDYVKQTGNPFQFFYCYNDAVENDPNASKFSEKSISYLKSVENEILKK